MTSIPEKWSVYPLADVTDADAPIIYGILQPGPNVPDGVPYVRPTEIEGSRIALDALRRTSSDIAKRYGRASLKHDDVLLSIVGTIGKVAIVPKELRGGNITQSSCRIRTDRRIISPELLALFLRSPAAVAQFGEFMLGTAVPRLNLEDVRRIRIPLPPQPEQGRIVAKIDSLSAKSKRARDHLDHAPKLIQKYKQAILSRAFQSSLEKNVTAKNIRPISDLILSLDQGWSPKCESEPAKFDNQWAVMKTTAVQPILFEAKENKKLPENLEPRPSLQVSEGDVIITRAGPRNRVGICAYVENTRPNLMICDKVYRLKINKGRACPKYIALMLNSPELLSVIEEMKSGINDSGLNLTQSKFLDIEVPCPGLDVQQKVVGLVETAFASINRLALEVASARRLVDHLDQVVLSKAFRGELVPQDPDDEPASVLLKRIKAEREGATPTRRGRGRPRLAATI
ncbi:restriction endonuclease subunit S [Methylobacterium sp. D53M]